MAEKVYHPETPQDSLIRLAWQQFCKDVKSLMIPRKKDRPLDQYLILRDKVFQIVEGEKFLDALEEAYNSTDVNLPVPLEVKEALLLEIQSFSRAAEVVHWTQKKKKKKRWFNKLLGQASTVSGSVKDILADNYPVLKGGLTLFNEAIDLFKTD